MTLLLRIHPDNPQVRLLDQAVQCIKNQGVVVYPTDSGYALCCCLENKSGVETIRRLRHLDKNHYFTLMFHTLSEIGRYAKINTATFRLLKAHTPGPYTFLLPATHTVPRRLLHPKRRTIGLRIPAHTISLALLSAINQPLMSVSYSSEAGCMGTDGEAIFDEVKGQVDMVIDGGYCTTEPTTVVDCLTETPQVIRSGQGSDKDFV